MPMPRIQHLSIGQRIGLALAFPILALIASSLWFAVDRGRALVDNHRAHEIVDLAAAANGLVHALQSERGRSVAQVSAGNQQLWGGLQMHYRETDQALAVFTAAAHDLDTSAMAQELAQQVRAGIARGAALTSLRQQVGRGLVASADLMDGYSQMVHDLTDLIRQMLLHRMEGELGRKLAAYVQLMQAKEYAGQERAIGAVGFAVRHFEVQERMRMVELAERQRLRLDDYHLYAGSGDSQGDARAPQVFLHPLGEAAARQELGRARALEQGWTMQDAARFSAMRQLALTDVGSDRIGPADVSLWFELASKRIELMRHDEVELAHRLTERVRSNERDAVWEAVLGIVLAMAALIATLLVARKLAIDIIVPLRRVTLGMSRLAQGDQDVYVESDWRSDEIGDMMRAMGVFQRNLAEIVQAQAKISGQAMVRRKERYQRALLDSFPFEVWLKDIEGRYLAVNRTLAENMGLSDPDAAIGQSDETLREPLLAAALRRSEQEVVLSGLPRVVEEGAPPIAGGPPRWLEIYNAPVQDDQGAVLGSVGFSRDISDRKQAQEAVRQLALYDALTKLPNRRLLHERLALAILQGRRDRRRLALAFIDLDGFKPVNDSFGHTVGDLLLQAVARRMQECVREVDTVARIGGDEFVVLLSQIDHPDAVLAVAEKIRRRLNQPFELDGGLVVSISSSTGVAVFPEHGADERSLTGNADLAMYQAKARGRNRVIMFSPEMAPDQSGKLTA